MEGTAEMEEVERGAGFEKTGEGERVRRDVGLKHRGVGEKDLTVRTLG